MSFEAEGKKEEAEKLFQDASDLASDNFEAFTAAPFLARSRKDPKDNLKWNMEALNRANMIAGEEMKCHYPSLYLNITKSHENLDYRSDTYHFYNLAANYNKYLPTGKYGDVIKSGISQGLQRTGSTNFKNPEIDELVNKWCDQKDLRPLSFILPAYLGNLGTQSEINALISTLSNLEATRCLKREDQEKIEKIISELSENSIQTQTR
jgi:hypothetical protein